MRQFSDIQVIDDKIIMPLSELNLLSSMDSLNKLKDSVKRKRRNPVKGMSQRLKELRDEMEYLLDMIEIERRKDQPLIKAEDFYKELENED